MAVCSPGPASFKTKTPIDHRIVESSEKRRVNEMVLRGTYSSFSARLSHRMGRFHLAFYSNQDREALEP